MSYKDNSEGRRKAEKRLAEFLDAEPCAEVEPDRTPAVFKTISFRQSTLIARPDFLRRLTAPAAAGIIYFSSQLNNHPTIYFFI